MAENVQEYLEVAVVIGAWHFDAKGKKETVLKLYAEFLKLMRRK